MPPDSNWIMTDDDSFQHVCSHNDTFHTFDLIEMTLINPETNLFQVYTNTICVNDYMKDERYLKTILTSFGYEDVQAVETAYGKGLTAYQVIAECIFEYESLYIDAECLLFKGQELECQDYIRQYVL
jgi:hypothetical protein